MQIEVHKEDTRGNVYRLLAPLKFRKLTVPAGFESDGASVPRFFWRLVFPPGEARALFAAFVHDYVYRTHPRAWTRKGADMVFRRLLVQGGVPPYRAALAYLGVRLFGKTAWREGGRK